MVHRDLGLLLIAVLLSGCAVWQKNIPTENGCKGNNRTVL